jgi:hypothetical protein
LTLGTYFYYRLNEDLSLSAYLSAEYIKQESGQSTYDHVKNKLTQKAD